MWASLFCVRLCLCVCAPVPGVVGEWAQFSIMGCIKRLHLDFEIGVLVNVSFA